MTELVGGQADHDALYRAVLVSECLLERDALKRKCTQIKIPEGGPPPLTHALIKRQGSGNETRYTPVSHIIFPDICPIFAYVVK